MAGKVTVGCKLPHGIIIEHPLDPAIKVEIDGLNKTVIKGATVAFTEVDAEFFGVWIAANKEFGPVKSGAIFAGKTSADAKAVAKEFKDRDTGFEPMKQKGDKRAAGVKPVPKNGNDEDDKE